MEGKMGLEDIKRLFLYEHEWEIKKGSEVVGKVYQRILTDANIERARREALRESASLRKKLRNKDSDEYAIQIFPLLELDREEIVAGIVSAETPVLQDRASRQARREIPFPVKPEEEDLEEQEKYQEEMDKYGRNVVEQSIKILAELIANRTDELSKEEDDEQLRKQLITALVNAFCMDKMLKTYQLWAAHLGTYRDKKCSKRLFDTYDEFRDTSTELQQQLVDGYFVLEIDRTTLKK